MGELLPEGRLPTERGHGFKETNGRDAEFPQHTFCNARDTWTTWRCATWYTTYGWTHRCATRNAADDGADDGSRNGSHANGSRNIYADDAGESRRRRRSAPELWWTRIWSTGSKSADGVRVWWWWWRQRWEQKSRWPWKSQMVASTNKSHNSNIQIGVCLSI